MSDLSWLTCRPGKHVHTWRDPALNVDFPIPESFMEKIRKDLARPLQEAEETISAALDTLDPDSVGWIILNGHLNP